MENESAPEPDFGKDPGVRKLERFLLREGGSCAFGTAIHEGMIRPINEHLCNALKAKGKRLSLFFLAPEQDASAFSQIQKAARTTDAMVVINLHDYLPGLPDEDRAEAKEFLEGFNFAREGLLDLGKPILFWVPKIDTFLLTNHTTDLYSMRRMHVWVDIQPSGFRIDWQIDITLKRSFFRFWDSSTNNPSLEKAISIYHDAVEANYPSEKMVAEIVLPLVVEYAKAGEHELAKGLLKQYEIQSNPSLPNFQHSLAEAMYWLYSPEEAIKRLQEAIDYRLNTIGEDQGTCELRYTIAQLCIEKNDLKTAFELLLFNQKAILALREKDLAYFFASFLFHTEGSTRLLLMKMFLFSGQYEEGLAQVAGATHVTESKAVSIEEAIVELRYLSDEFYLEWGRLCAANGYLSLGLSVFRSGMEKGISQGEKDRPTFLGISYRIPLEISVCMAKLALGDYRGTLRFSDAVMKRLSSIDKKNEIAFAPIFTQIQSQAQQALSQDPHQSSPATSY